MRTDTTTTRRSAIGQLALTGALAGAGGIVAASSAGLAAASPAHPDAELLQAEQDWRAAFRASSVMYSRADAEDVDADPPWDEQRRLVKVIIALPAYTPAGIAVKLRMAFFQSNSDLEIEEFLVQDGPRPDHLLDDDAQRLVWQAIEALDAMPGGRV